MVRALKAAGEPTRLRILLLLHRSELTVGEIQQILGQSQPRVSRHLRLLSEAGLLNRHSEGSNVFYQWARDGFASRFLRSIHTLGDPDEPLIRRDQTRLAQIRANRAELAARTLAGIETERSVLAHHTAPDETVEAQIIDALGPQPNGVLLDIGTGTGRMIELLSPSCERAIGIEPSREMLNLARTRLDSVGLDHYELRQGNAYDLDMEPCSVSLAVLHHVLHFLDEPGRAVDEVGRTVEHNGRLLIIDFAAHNIEDLRLSHNHRRLGFTEQEVVDWCTSAGFDAVETRHISAPTHHRGQDGLVVSIWVATRSHTPNHPAPPHTEMTQ